MHMQIMTPGVKMGQQLWIIKNIFKNCEVAVCQENIDEIDQSLHKVHCKLWI